MIRRVVGKISNDNPEDGLINLLAEMTGLSASQLSLSKETLDGMKEVLNERMEIKKIINPFFDDLKSQNTRESNKKINELIYLGKFIWKAGWENEIEIVECGEQPDFIIKYQEELIGVEHTGIYDDDVVAEINIMKRILSKSQTKLNNSNITGLFNIIVVPSKLKKKLPLKENEIVDSICECIIAQHQKEETQKPDFITNIIQMPYPILELTLGEDYWLKELTPESIGKTISKKENKISTYKSLKHLNKCWLLIVVDGISSASSFDVKLETLPIHLTPFDTIYIFDNFKGTIIKGKKI